MKKYKYLGTNNSFFYPFLLKHTALPIVRALPKRVTANHVTFSSFIVANLLWISIATLGIQPITFILSGILLLIYALTDIVDGALARLTNNANSLGEFMDHFQGTIGSSICLFVPLYLFQIHYSWFVIGAFWIIFLAHCKTSTYQKQTNHMVLSKIGDLEKTVLLVLFLFSAAYPPIYQFYLSPGPFSLSKIAFFVLVLLLLLTIKTLIAIVTTKGHPKQFFLYAVFGLTFFYSLSGWGIIHQTLFLVPYSMHFIGSIIRSHLLEEPYPYPDLLAPLFVLLVPLFTTNPLYMMGLPISYLWARALYSYFKTIRRLIQ